MNFSFSNDAKPLFSYKPYWAKRFGAAPFLPMSRDEMNILGWDSCDIILVTGDAYVDHPSFAMAILGRLLEEHGFRVGIISQPNWQNTDDFMKLGKPNLYFGISAGNMDSMVNHYTSDRKIRHNDAYTPGDVSGKRPDRALLVYSQRAKEAYKDAPIIVGGIEASLRRIAHYDYWSEKIRRSALLDSRADMLLFGNGERSLVEISHRLAKGEKISDMLDIRGSALNLPHQRNHFGLTELDSTTLDEVGKIEPLINPYTNQVIGSENEQTPNFPKDSSFNAALDEPEMPTCGTDLTTKDRNQKREEKQQARRTNYIRLPSFDQVKNDKVYYAHTSRLLHLETNPYNARPLVQQHGDRDVWVNPPPLPLETKEMDGVYDLPYSRAPHPEYKGAKIAAWEMIKFSVNIMRGCFGGCSFCSITEHEGRIIQNRSQDSILREIEEIRDRTEGFTGVISDLGGPTANMYRLACKDPQIEHNCRRFSCVSPDICKNLDTNHKPLIELYRQARNVKGVKKILIASGLRYDLAIRDEEYVKELVTHHVGGYLKIAPEHTEEAPLAKMMKPSITNYDKFKVLFEKFSKEAGKKQYLIPYFIAAHPGTSDEDMMNLALWLKRNGFRADQVQAFIPTPMSLAGAMYHSEKNPLKPVKTDSEAVLTPKGLKHRRLHKAFLRYHDPENWPLLREALKQMGRADLIGNSKNHLIPLYQPKGTGFAGGEGKRLGKKHQQQSFTTKGVFTRPKAASTSTFGKPSSSKTTSAKPSSARPQRTARQKP